MANLLLEFTKNSIWQAFTALSEPNGLETPKSRLKVFVASLATILDCPGVDKGLDDFRSTSTLNFAQFEYYLTREVFSTLSESTSRSEFAPLEKHIDEICWTLTKSKLNSTKRDPCLDKDSAFKLFRIFCLLADLIRDDEGNAQVLISPEEADLVFNKFLSTLNKDLELNEDFECLFSNAIFDFQTLLSVVELKFMKHFQKEEVIEVINEIYDEFVDDIIKKGSVLKRGEYLPKFVEKLFILRSSGLTYYTNPKRPKVISFDAQTRVEEAPENPNSKLFMFSLITSERVLHLATLDKRYRTQWMSSLRLAISRLHCRESYGRFLRNKRRLEWHRLRIRRTVEVERSKEMLMAEKMARQAAEDQAKELAEQKAAEEEQRRHLDEVRRQLEKLLAEEIQAKKDEEMVRSLQARILNEEWEKREELEKLQEEQRLLLDMERNKTKTFQRRQTEMERQLEGKGLKLEEASSSNSTSFPTAPPSSLANSLAPRTLLTEPDS